MNDAAAPCSPVEATMDTADHAGTTLPARADLRALAAALRTLDELLAVAVDKQARTLGAATLLDPWRGLHLDRRDVDRLLARSVPATFGADGVVGLLARAARAVPQMAAVAARNALTDADLGLLLIALAVDADLKYQRIFGYLQDDVARKRPTPIWPRTCLRRAPRNACLCSRDSTTQPR